MITSIGAVCFGIVIGYVTYRTLVRTVTSSISDLAAVVAAIGGGVVTQVFDPATGDSFGYYAIGLLAGMTIFLVLRIVLEMPRQEAGAAGASGAARAAPATVLGGPSGPPAGGGAGAPSPAPPRPARAAILGE